jgi:folate-dependent phosphoribosylglycinamide formyltransferase PurN
MLSLIKDINKKKYANIKLIVSNNCNSLGLMEAKKLGLNTHFLLIRMATLNRAFILKKILVSYY